MMKRALLAVLAAMALFVAVPIASRPAMAAPAMVAAFDTDRPALVQKAHSARWYYARRHYRPYRHAWRPAYYRPVYYRPVRYGRPYWHRRHHWRPRYYYGGPYGYRRHHWRPRYYGRPYWHHRRHYW
jgi:hypothetical protein